ncbi:MAG: holo-ACP synthase [Selenomonadaceae bacterium]
MIVGTGIDIIEIKRVRKAIESQKFVQRVFTQKEIVYCESRGVQAAASYAARFAGKEAIMKALGTGLRKGSLVEIEILSDALGCPTVSLNGYFCELAQEKRVTDIHISLSHAREYAAAQAILWRD